MFWLYETTYVTTSLHYCLYSFLLLIELKYNFLVIVGALFLAVTQFATALHLLLKIIRVILVIISHYPDDNPSVTLNRYIIYITNLLDY